MTVALAACCIACSETKEIAEIATQSTTKVAKERVDIALTALEWEVNEAAQGFALRLMEATMGGGDTANMCLSPLSAQIALSMACNGAEGVTKNEMLETLGYEGKTQETMNSYNKQMIASLEDVDNTTTVTIANSIWGDETFDFKAEYVQSNAESYDAVTASVDFGSETSVEEINEWCSYKTKGCIKKILDEAPGGMRMLLLNALYFKGMWEEPFDKSNTARETFRNADGSETEVEMMHQDGTRYAYYANGRYAAAELPYGNEAYSMVIVLPGEGVGTSECVRELAEGGWQGIADSSTYCELDLKLPKFEMNYRRSMLKDLEGMGMHQAFTTEADFGGISDERLHIGMVNQCTYIAVDEEGTEAAAVTAIGIVTTSMPTKEKTQFHADRPFIYMIKERSTGAILFFGKIERL